MPWLNRVGAVLETWYGGQEQGHQIADVLLGHVNPSGKLPITFPQSRARSPISTKAQYPGVNNTATYSEGLQVGYRWYEAHNVAPLFPFGYGLSYTTFSLSNLGTVSSSYATTGLKVSVNVKNTGGLRGADVAQVYVSLPSSTGEPPRRLVGFQRVELAPGQTQRITITVPPRELAYWNSGKWTIAPGSYTLNIGDSSRNLHLTRSFRLAGGSAA